tara:strand:+ start:829 stop:1032 length:204 start_codon:yes stop_codon:yes gene_type:complete
MNNSTDEIRFIANMLQETARPILQALEEDQMAVIANPKMMPVIQLSTSIAVAVALEALAELLDRISG